MPPLGFRWLYMDGALCISTSPDVRCGLTPVLTIRLCSAGAGRNCGTPIVDKRQHDCHIGAYLVYGGVRTVSTDWRSQFLITLVFQIVRNALMRNGTVRGRILENGLVIVGFYWSTMPCPCMVDMEGMFVYDQN